MENQTKVIVVEQKHPVLGRNVVHDPQSRSFARKLEVDPTAWRNKRVALYEPIPNPDQGTIGCCTGCAKASQFNAIRNRVKGRVLRIDDALKIYSKATELDPWAGSYPPIDTGSSGLASAQAAKILGYGLEYYWHFGGVDEVIHDIVVNGKAVSIGSWWYWDMFSPDKDNRITPTGGKAGGHQYIARGYDKKRDWVMIRCWWGPGYRDVWIARQDLNDLLMDDGDAHWQRAQSYNLTK